MQTLLIWSIKAYRYLLSPYIGQHCRFQPTCSAYAETALAAHGLVKGSMLAISRVCRCHPWHEGGFDPVPEKISTGRAEPK